MSEGATGLFFSVGEVASMLGISPHTIRAWERRHLALRPVRTASGQRRYSAEDVELLRHIKFERHAHGLSMRLATLSAQGMLVQDDTADQAAPGEGSDSGASGVSEDPIRMVANLIGEIVIVLDLEGRIEDANTAFVRFSDVLPSRLRGLRFSDLVDPVDRAKGVQVYASPLRRRPDWELHLTGSRRRALFAFDCRPVSGPRGTRVVLIGTELALPTATAAVPTVAPETAVPSFPAPLLTLLDGAPDPIRVLDLFSDWTTSTAFGVALASLKPVPTIVRSNGVLRSLVGAGGPARLPLSHLWGARAGDRVAAAVERAARTGGPEGVRGWVPAPGGDRGPAVDQVELMPLRAPSGDVTHLLVRVDLAVERVASGLGDRLLAAVLALRAATDPAGVFTAAAEQGRDLVRDTEVLVARSTGSPGVVTVVAAGGRWDGLGDADPCMGLVRESLRTGARHDLVVDRGDGTENLHVVPTASRRTDRAEVGVFAFARRGHAPFTRRERHLMDEFADRVALALDAVGQSAAQRGRQLVGTGGVGAA